jgi:hypothetical protein
MLHTNTVRLLKNLIPTSILPSPREYAKAWFALHTLVNPTENQHVPRLTLVLESRVRINVWHLASSGERQCMPRSDGDDSPPSPILLFPLLMPSRQLNRTSLYETRPRTMTLARNRLGSNRALSSGSDVTAPTRTE